MRRFTCVVLVFVVAAGLAAAAEVDTVSKVFTLDHIGVADASAAIQPMLSEDGSLTINPGRSRITVQDVPGVVDEISEMLDVLDRLPGQYSVHFELIQGSEKPYSSARPVSEGDGRLRKMFNFPSIRRIGGTTVEGRFGNPAHAGIGGPYKVSFTPEMEESGPQTPWAVRDRGLRIHLRHIVLERVLVDSSGIEKTEQLLRTSASLSANQKVYIGAGNSEDAQNGLVLIVHAQSVEAR